MKKAKIKKLKLEEIKLNSFVTEIVDDKKATVEGGFNIPTINALGLLCASATAVSGASPTGQMSLLTTSGSIYIKSAIATSSGTTTAAALSLTVISASVSYISGQLISEQVCPTFDEECIHNLPAFGYSEVIKLCPSIANGACDSVNLCEA